MQTRVSRAAQAEEMEFEDEDEDGAEGDADEDVELGDAKPAQKAKVELTPKVPKVPEGGEEPIQTDADDTDNDGKASFSIMGEPWEKKPEVPTAAKQSKVSDRMLKEGEAWAAKVHESINSEGGTHAATHEVHADGTAGTLSEATKQLDAKRASASHHSAPRATHAEDADTEIAVKKLKAAASPAPEAAAEAEAEAEAAPEFDSGIPARHPAGTAPSPQTAWNGKASEVDSPEVDSPALETDRLKAAAKQQAPHRIQP